MCVKMTHAESAGPTRHIARLVDSWRMRDKVVIVTGASSGIGKSCAQTFSACGSNVVLAARDETALEQVMSTLEGECLGVKTDVSVESDCRNLIASAVQRFGRIDVLINNAGISMRALFRDVDLAVLHRVMDVNFWGTVNCTKFALPYLLEAKGSVVGVSSIAGFKGLPGRTGYSSSKFAMHGFLESLRTENLKTGLHVLLACPGFTGTDIRHRALTADGTAQGTSPREEGRMMTSDEVSKRIYKAVVKRKRTVIMTRQGRMAVLAGKFFPSFTDRQVFKLMAKEPDSPFK
jgi:NAD(P)-dependent dehydrogenase (short-subunit alcohol dehydrogenase family)